MMGWALTRWRALTRYSTVLNNLSTGAEDAGVHRYNGTSFAKQGDFISI